MTTTQEWANRVIDRKDKEIKDLRELFLTASDDADRWQDCAETAEAALYRVKALHARHALTLGAKSAVCNHCHHLYPCPTIQAIDERPQSPHWKPGEQE